MDKISKILAARGISSRRGAEELIRAGRVTIGGVAVTIGDRAAPDADIAVDGKPLPPVPEYIYIMLNKPRGVVTTARDEKNRKTVLDLLDGVTGRVVPVGRLDMDSEGLLLLTNDGELIHRLTHPSFEIEKVYNVWVRGDIDTALELWRHPMIIDGLSYNAQSVELTGTDGEDTVLSVTLKQGRNRQIRKMCEHSGLQVRRLRRVKLGALTLGSLRRGQWRELTAAEIRSIHI